MKKPRYLTKSRFKLGSECPAKLFYTGKPEYPDQKQADSFLMALAEGGFQVGELAKLYFPGGHDITTLDYDESLQQTNELLREENVIIYEGAIRHKNLFIRADIIVKKGNRIELIEVKAKSCDSTDDHIFTTKKGNIESKWKPYLEDIAFQKHVMSQAFPAFNISAYLMLADKSSVCPTDGLNQKFMIVQDGNGRKSVFVSDDITGEDLSSRLLCQINVDDLCDDIYQSDESKDALGLTFQKRIAIFASHYEQDEKIKVPISSACAKCEFYCDSSDEGKKSGLQECWREQLGWHDQDFLDPTILDLWDFRRKDQLIAEGRIKLADIKEDDIKPKADDRPGLSRTERQWIQAEKAINNDNSVWLDVDSLRQEMDSWAYPLHFIDFETTMTAIPFNKGMHPYEGVAFQFSHHYVYEDGRVEHATEYLNADRGVFPNYDFLRNLKAALGRDEGSIFRFHNHENTFLNHIYKQLQEDANPPPDKDDLCDFIRSISKSKKDSVDTWEGSRNMIDLCDLVKRYYYDPATNGSNSIKQVLPAMLNSNEYLKRKYSAPIYGAADGISSKNFTDWTWIQLDDIRQVQDPYKLLPRMFTDIPHNAAILSESDELNDGGAALTAYARMQFEEMSDYERDELKNSLLKYCELDTMAMVMIYEGWREMIRN